jgi:putative hydrolase of the HAD superfamily
VYSLSSPRYEAVLFDALGTLVRLEPPWPFLRAALASRGVEVSEDEARDAMRAEMAYYIEHHPEGADRESLIELRQRCARVMGEQLPAHAAAALSPDELIDALLDSLRFTPFPDAAPTLGRLRTADVRVAVVSNWDCSLGSVLGELGLAGLLDTVVTSAEAGARKPEPAIFEAALARLQSPPEAAILVGDSLDTDVAGGRAAGIRSVLLDRTGTTADNTGVEWIVTLDNVPELMTVLPKT